MSRTSNGNLTGRAASEDRADFRQFLGEVENPRSSFWQGKANDALVRLQNVVGDEEGKRQVENIEGTYKSICEQIALIADLAEAQALERRLADDTCPACGGSGEEIVHGEIEGCANCGGAGRVEDGTHPSPIISGGDIVEIIPQAGDDEIPF